jgi:hypothetical protein
MATLLAALVVYLYICIGAYTARKSGIDTNVLVFVFMWPIALLAFLPCWIYNPGQRL